jgi:hypothetical protein
LPTTSPVCDDDNWLSSYHAYISTNTQWDDGQEQYVISLANEFVENNCTVPEIWEDSGGFHYTSGFLWIEHNVTAPPKACQVVEGWNASYSPSSCYIQWAKTAHHIGCGSAFNDKCYIGICVYSSWLLCL